LGGEEGQRAVARDQAQGACGDSCDKHQPLGQRAAELEREVLHKSCGSSMLVAACLPWPLVPRVDTEQLRPLKTASRVGLISLPGLPGRAVVLSMGRTTSVASLSGNKGVLLTVTCGRLSPPFWLLSARAPLR